MKRTLLIAAVMAGALTLSASGQAGSPKGDAQARENNIMASTTTSCSCVTSAGYQAVGDDGIAASPKGRQLLNERKMVTRASSDDVASLGYQAVGADGIAASPKGRAQLNEHSSQMMIVAPLK